MIYFLCFHITFDSFALCIRFLWYNVFAWFPRLVLSTQVSTPEREFFYGLTSFQSIHARSGLISLGSIVTEKGLNLFFISAIVFLLFSSSSGVMHFNAAAYFFSSSSKILIWANISSMLGSSICAIHDFIFQSIDTWRVWRMNFWKYSFPFACLTSVTWLTASIDQSISAKLSFFNIFQISVMDASVKCVRQDIVSIALYVWTRVFIWF